MQYDDESIQEKTNFTSYINHFSLDHGNPRDKSRIEKLHKYLMEKHSV